MSPEEIVIYSLIAFAVVKVGAVVCALIAGQQVSNEEYAREKARREIRKALGDSKQEVV